MKKIVLEFIRRGFTACGFGPLVLAGLYLILQNQGILEMLTVNEVCLGIVSLTVLAFTAGGMNVIYQIEQLPLMVAISIHGTVLYTSYLMTYLLNGWLEWGTEPLLIFSAIFVVAYLVIWAVIWFATMRNTKNLNEKMKQKRLGRETITD